MFTSFITNYSSTLPEKVEGSEHFLELCVQCGLVLKHIYMFGLGLQSELGRTYYLCRLPIRNLAT
jgi:hypothetical protein